MPLNMTRKHNVKLLIGDWLVIIIGFVAVIFMFQQFWSFAPANKLKIRQGNKIIGIYDLNQMREIIVHGAIADAKISILQGKVRFKQSPCNNQYCVHQGWLSRAGQVAICIPNQISLQLIGAKSSYDSLNY